MFFIAMFWFITEKKKNLEMVCLASSASGVKLSVHMLQRPESREGFRGQGPSQGAFTLPVPVPVTAVGGTRNQVYPVSPVQGQVPVLQRELGGI